MTGTSRSALPATRECRVAYATVVAMMAAADNVIAVEELDELKGLCKALELTDEETTEVLGAASNQDRAAFARAIEQMKTSNLRFTLLADCISLAHADHELAPGEAESLQDLAKALGITDDQFASLQEYAGAVRRATEGREGNHEETGRKLAGKLAAVGVPVGVLGLGSGLALTATGAASGAAALAAGLGIASGFGAAVGLGIVTIYGLRWLRKQVLQGRGERDA
jgi:uncharacterized tellurite resistance protein B-like protein